MNSLTGRLAFGTYILVVSAIFILTWDKILGFLIFLTIAVQAAGSYALRHPDSKFAWIFFRQNYGPEMRIRRMTRGELFRSGFNFLNMSLYPFITLIALRVLPGQFQGRVSTDVFTVVYFASSVFFLICAGLGVYFLMRGLFRRNDYVPQTDPVDETEEAPRERETANMP